MDLFYGISEAFALIPDWISFFIVLPAVLVLACVEGGTGGKRRTLFSLIDGALLGIGAVLLAGKGSARIVLFGGSFVLLTALRPLAVRGSELAAGCVKRKKPTRCEMLTDSRYPPKICRFEEPSSDMPYVETSYAEELLLRLARLDLSPSDRMEQEALSRSLLALKKRPLDAEESSRLNDALASTLKLAARYKL